MPVAVCLLYYCRRSGDFFVYYHGELKIKYKIPRRENQMWRGPVIFKSLGIKRI